MRKKPIKVILSVLCTASLFVGSLCACSAAWYVRVYGNLAFESAVYTLLAGTDGTESGLVLRFLGEALLPALLLSAFLGLFLFLPTKRCLVMQFGRKIRVRFYPFTQWIAVLCVVAITIGLVRSAAGQVDLKTYLDYITAEQTTFFEDNYVDPAQAHITFPEQKQNLICIYLESMETTFLSREQGGGSDVCMIPELYSLAQENTNFSHHDGVGGFSALSGSVWTVGAMVAMTSGVPMKPPFNISGNDYGQDVFLPGITSMSDILHDNGYYQALMVGSEGEFGGRKQYYEQHGTDRVYDLFTAREDGIIPEDYYVWWGMEDMYLYEYAKQELLEISKQEQPFAFTMLTVDTHHISGYVCELCGSDHEEQYENVLSCASRQVAEFVGWLQQQDFYENTTILICGDHPTMDGEYIARNVASDFDRRVYNCFLNAKTNTEHTKNREFSTMDLFPTVLAAIGCRIEGDRLGLGTNLFAQTPTLCEELGTDAFDNEVAKQSDYYAKTFY